MNYQFVKGNTKGKEQMSLSISPSDNLEREFFNTLFAQGSEVEFKTIANKEEVLICKKEENKEQ